jgi:hypothetical protein
MATPDSEKLKKNMNWTTGGSLVELALQSIFTNDPARTKNEDNGQLKLKTTT